MSRLTARFTLTSRFAMAATVAALALTLGAPANAGTLKWITSKTENAGDAQQLSTSWLVDQFKIRTGGKEDIKVFWGGSVAKDKEIPDFISGGAADMGDIITPYFPDKFPLNNAVGYFIPQPHSTIEIAEMMQYWHRVYPQFDAELAKYNLKVLGFRPLESYGMICTKPIKSIEDFKGKRIRTYGFAYPAFVQALGATPVSMSTADAYEALQHGILDCSPIGPSLANGWKYDEVAKYYIDMPIGASFGHMITINLKSYNALDPQVRAILDGLGREYAMRYTVDIDVITKKIVKGWKDKGVTVIHLPKEQFAKIGEFPAVKAVRAKWLEKAKAAGVPADEIAEDITGN